MRVAALGALAVALCACSFDRTPLEPTEQMLGGTLNASGALGGGSGSGGTEGPSVAAGSEAGGTGGGAAEPAAGEPGPAGSGGDSAALELDAGPTGQAGDTGVPAPVDAGTPDTGVDAGQAAVDSGSTSGVEPTPGELFARCTREVGCADGLTCYGTLPGYCAQECSENADCVDHGGVDFTCSPTHLACRVECDPQDGAAACPAPLSCEMIDGVYRCRYPLEVGSFDRGLFEPCDLAHGDDDCADGRVCFRSEESAFDGPGYCTDPCGVFQNNACEQDAASAAYTCSGGTCRLDCSEGSCPSGMVCEPIGDGGLCHYLP